jgi:hypothetical protein
VANCARAIVHELSISELCCMTGSIFDSYSFTNGRDSELRSIEMATRRITDVCWFNQYVVERWPLIVFSR